MKKRIINSALLILFVFFLSCGAPSPELKLNYFDQASLRSEKIRLCVLHPSYSSLNSLINLKESGIFGDEHLEVVGVFHEQERTDYRNSFDLVRVNNLDWIKFHQLKGNLHKDNLFQKNDLTSEFEKIISKSDGIIFFGGADIPPYIYGEKTNLLTSIRTPMRHFLELSFVFHLLGGYQNSDLIPLLESCPDFPVLGICLGEQTLNIGTGGRMIQDIWSEKYGKKFLEEVMALSQDNWHTNPYSRLYPEKNLFPYNLHPIKLTPEGMFVERFGYSAQETPLICSSHHQAVDELGKGMEVCATTLDGQIIEAIQHKKYQNVLGIQFHPEFPLLWDPEASYLFLPQDEKEFTPLETLKNSPPSFSFHKKIWSWFYNSLQEVHENRIEEK
ncbi:MAG: gamma-glutamyl-gamma-aminobutyrate hydrolase family protein [Acidobacteriota bacterium]